MKKSWFVYAVFLTIVVVLGEAANIAKGKEITLLTLLNWISTSLMCVAVFGYASQKKTLSIRLWKMILWVIASLSLILVAKMILQSGIASVVGILVILPFILPAYLAMYWYVYLSPNIWAQTPNNSLTVDSSD